ncbi:DUF4968 domain-containing protein [Euzebyella marina]|uniref:DUF4968 domain-containing protein n=1 Tax=Euzebyella marina TaxID=1761453 RepID=A0A3G2L223_9FLAO|nr:TIM-barrel domain-containing protein [Euzebyella marina]AYN66298.1 DUF4968 domain-containing protein [Euzebyella marina]
MRMLRLGLFMALLMNIVQAHAQTGLGNFQKVDSENGNKIVFATDEAKVQLEFCTPSLVRIRSSWDGDFSENEPWMVVKYDWPEVIYTAKESEATISYSTDSLNILVHKTPFFVTISDKEGKVLTSEAEQDKIFGSSKNKDTVNVTKKLFPDEHFFGFGERMDFLDRRGKALRLNVGRGQGRPHIVGAYDVLQANYSPVPFFMSTRGYGIFLHNANPTNWNMGHSNPETYSFSAEGGELDYYFMYGPDFSSILDAYTDITGKAPMLPKFAMGLHVGTYSGGTWGHEEETSTDYVVALAQKFRDLNIPLDVLHLDSTWRIFGENGGTGATSFEWRETFKNPEEMFNDLYALNLNMVGLHLRPRFDNGKELRLLDEARRKGYVYPEPNNLGEFVNFFDEKSVDWWWKNGVKRVADQGAMFLKTDEGSAFGHKANESEKTGPQGKEINALHNLFPIAYAKAPYEKFAEHNKMRGMNQTREGYAGIQRYPYIFAGDWPSEWQYFEPVIKAGLNIGLSGVGNWAHCMGGFEHVADPELYIRWCQFGLMSPIAHLFGMEHPNYKEPWNYGEEAQSIFKKYDELRYELMPYLYSTLYQNHSTGQPLMRALVLDYQKDPNVYEITDQYMLGDNLMVCPVTTKGAQTRTVYLPEGNWVDYWTGNTFSGKKFISVLCPLDKMPLFVKAGGILPKQELINYVGEKEINSYDLEVFIGGDSAFELYHDDGKSMKYTEGDFATTLIKAESKQDRTVIQIDPSEGKFDTSDITYNVKVHLNEKPKTVMVNNEKLVVSDTENENNPYYCNRLLYIPNLDNSHTLNVEVIQ